MMMMASVEKILRKMKNNPSNIRYSDLEKVCLFYFGDKKRQKGSHSMFNNKGSQKLIVIQPFHGMAKEYQVKQVLDIISESERKRQNGK